MINFRVRGRRNYGLSKKIIQTLRTSLFTGGTTMYETEQRTPR